VVFIWTKVSGAIIEALPNLRLILTMSTGYDHIDLGACRARGITVCNVPHYGENTVAEHTFALILSLSRKLHAAYFQGLRGEFRIRELRGFDLYGKTLGVVGAGNIGLHVIRIARGFGMRVLAYDLRARTRCWRRCWALPTPTWTHCLPNRTSYRSMCLRCLKPITLSTAKRSAR
jgi:D-lactate dehydrogenase